MSTQNIFLNATTQNLQITTSFIDRTHIEVILRTQAQREAGEDFDAANALTPGLGYTWVNDGIIQLATVPTGVDDYLVRRRTPVLPISVQQPGVFSSERANLATQQALNLGEEARDIADAAEGRSLRVPYGEVAPAVSSLSGQDGKVLQVQGDQLVPVSIADAAGAQYAAEAQAARDAVIAVSGAPEFANFSAGLRATAAGSSFVVYKQGQLLRYVSGVSLSRDNPVFSLPTSPTFTTPPELAPGSRWTGVAGSGFGTVPSDPTRTTAKPALRLLVPPRQRFTDTLVVGALAFANNAGTLIEGVQVVRFYFEGRVLEVASPTYRRFADANGNLVTYLGYWATLKKPAGKVGEARLYVEAVPTNTAMQRRVLGPFSFYPQATLYDLELTVNPDAAITGNNYGTFAAALQRIRTNVPVPANPRITIQKALVNEPMPFATGVTVTNYITVESAFPMTFGNATLDTTSAVDTNSLLRPAFGPIWLKGSNITVDFANSDAISPVTGHEWVLDGINLTNSNGPNALYRGGINNQGRCVTGNPWFLECAINNVANACVGANLVRGCVLSNVKQDIFSDARCVVASQVQRHNDAFTNDDIPAVSIVYTGAQATATVAKAGGVDPNNATITFKWGANTRVFSCGRLATYYATGLSGDQGYTFAHLVTWVNTVLAGLDAGWSATLLNTDGRRASSASLLGLKGQPFGDTSCKTTALTVMSNFDAHGDFYQEYFSGVDENVIVCDCIGYDMQTQNIFLSSTLDAKDMAFVNNALANDIVGANYYDQATIQSQIGRSSNATVISHVMIVHNSMPNQTLTFRNDGTVTTFDANCLIANNSCRNVAKASEGNTVGATIRNNHVHTGQTPMTEATGTTVGGDQNSLYAGFNTGNFAPAGALLANLKAPAFAVDLATDRRAPTAPAGALA